jgi:hypothetical protein
MHYRLFCKFWGMLMGRRISAIDLFFLVMTSCGVIVFHRWFSQWVNCRCVFGLPILLNDMKRVLIKAFRIWSCPSILSM